MKLHLTFNFKQIERDPLRFEGKAPANSFDISDDEMVSFGDIGYDLTVAQISGGAMACGAVEVFTKSRCGRCLKISAAKLEIKDISHFYEKDADKEFDLIPDIREDILIALPSNILCGEECKGLCPSCGTDLNVSGCGCDVSSSLSVEGIWDKLDELKIKTKCRGKTNGSTKKKKV
ncbi:MAG TPA: DUF177 domain-containing protein [Victivallales bacterium]|nr:DUF177 domain-containing protein [Victivallales bacterium]